MADIDLKLLKVLTVMLEVPNTRKAGEVLHLSQSSVSKSLNKLREHFNDPLFIRDSYGMKPTLKAIELGKTLPQALNNLLNVINESSEFNPALLDERITISMNSFVFPWLGAKLFQCISTQAPKVELNLKHWTLESERELLKGHIDIGLSYLSPFVTKNISQRKLVEDDFVFLVNKKHKLTGQAVGPDMFNQYALASLIIPSWNLQEARAIESIKSFNPNVRLLFRSTSLHTLLEIVRHSDLLLPLPRRLAMSLDSKAYETLEIHPILPQPDGTTVVLVDKVRQSDPLITWLVKEIKGVAIKSLGTAN